MKSFLWKIFYSGWRNHQKRKIPGYSILMMVPGDLPVFLKIAMEVCARQDSDHLCEVIVIPDSFPADFKQYFQKLEKTWTLTPLRLITLNTFEYALTRRFNNPHMNNWLQFVRGCNAVKTTHALWHDADLFISRSDFAKTHFEKCRDGKFCCYGLSEVWDDWYRQNGFSYMTSTWELMMSMDWVKRFKPWQHRGHDGQINGLKHTFDITLLPQCLSSRENIGYWKNFKDFVHFNYIIGNYRNFQNSEGPFEDVGLKLLLVRLLIDLFDDSGYKYDVPDFSDLLRGFEDTSCRVTYLKDSRRGEYVDFRAKILALKDSIFINKTRKVNLEQRLLELDRHFNYMGVDQPVFMS